MPDTPRSTNTIRHHGGAHGVTGSCHELVLGPDASLLIDCGLFQGEDAAPRGGADQLAIEFDVRRVVALVVTHVHIDHLGMCPSFFLGGAPIDSQSSDGEDALNPLILLLGR